MDLQHSGGEFKVMKEAGAGSCSSKKQSVKTSSESFLVWLVQTESRRRTFSPPEKVSDQLSDDSVEGVWTESRLQVENC